MEFLGDINIFDAVDFETAVPRNTGRTTAELLIQASQPGNRRPLLSGYGRISPPGGQTGPVFTLPGPEAGWLSHGLPVVVQGRADREKYDDKQVDGLPHPHHEQYCRHYRPGREFCRRVRAQEATEQGAAPASRLHPSRGGHRPGPEDGPGDPVDAGS